MNPNFKLRDLVAIIAAVGLLLAAVALPAIGRAKQRAERISCVCHLKQIGLSFRIWANDHESNLSNGRR